MTGVLPHLAPATVDLLVQRLNQIAQSATCLVLGHDWTLWASATELLRVCERCETTRSTSIPYEFEDDPVPGSLHDHH